VLRFRIWNLLQFKDQLAVRIDVELLQAVVIPLIKETVLDIIRTSGLGMLVGFINNLQVVTTISYNIVVGFTQFTNPTH
jgi:hypothetical protein